MLRAGEAGQVAANLGLAALPVGGDGLAVLWEHVVLVYVVEIGECFDDVSDARVLWRHVVAVM